MSFYKQFYGSIVLQFTIDESEVEIVNTHFLSGWPVEVDVTFRLLLAYSLGGIIGWDRERDGQAAGLRTHMMVAVGSAGFTLVFIFGFVGVGTSSDPGRAASQIITGVGFLGAGVIWRSQTRVRGITTAADIWVVAAIGMMAGTGMWYLAIFVAVLVFVTLRFLKPTDQILRDKKARKSLAAKEISPISTAPQEETNLD